MGRRYQVFVSSTYADLTEERSKVIQMLLALDCIPAGMELFPALDEEQFEFIKRVIDDCDYYLLIIGGRYGSTTADGLSYTEKEYDYAVESGLKVVALIHGDPGSIPMDKSEGDPEVRKRLLHFRERVAAERLVKKWSFAEELPALVAQGLTATIKSYPAKGWVRGTVDSHEKLLVELNAVRKQNGELLARIAELEADGFAGGEGLARLDESVEFSGPNTGHFGDKREWSRTMTWGEAFACISPYLMGHPSAERVRDVLLDGLRERPGNFMDSKRMNDQGFQTFAVQMKALGLVRIEYSKTVQGGMGLFWSLTQRGERLMFELRAIGHGGGSSGV